MAKPTKTVLMIHRNNEQGNIWQLILSLRGLDVVWEPEQVDIGNLLETFRAIKGDLPSLLLVDTNLDSNNKTKLEAISICHWCREHYPKLKIILINYSPSRIPVAQKFQATRCALYLLPELNVKTLTDSINRIGQVLDLPLLPSPVQEIFIKKANPVLAYRKSYDETNLSTAIEDENPKQSAVPLGNSQTKFSATPSNKWAVPVILLGLLTGGYFIWQRIQLGDSPNTASVKDASNASGTLTMAGSSFSGHSTFRSKAFQEALQQSGIDLRYQVASDARSAELLNQGKADLELTTLDEFLRHNTQGKIVGLINHTVGADAIVLNTKRYPGLKSLPDLVQLVEQARSQGQQLEIAFPENTPSEYLLLLLSAKFEGFKLSDFHVKKVADVADDWKLLQDPNQNIAVTVLREPDVTHARQQGYTAVLSSEDVPDEIVDVIVASNRALESQPEQIAKLLEAYYRRVDADLRDASQLKNQIAEDAKLSPADAVLLMQGIEFYSATEARHWLKSGKLEKRIGATAAVLTLAGKINQVPQSPNDLFTSQFIDRAANNTETLISQIRAVNPKLADRLAGKENPVKSDRQLDANQIQKAPVIGDLKVPWNVKFDANSTNLAAEGKQALDFFKQGLFCTVVVLVCIGI
ncbi:MAG: hypothetical protein MUD14_30420, partial [Hydrococcus sp. Prado102]|nr:hypothetical protein [Hydrococcus sp. Prado102]